MPKEAKGWLQEIQKAAKRMEDFFKEGEKLVSIYEAGKSSKSIDFNILYSNTETLAPALYNSLPRPVVRPRFKDSRPLDDAASNLMRRLLEYLEDTGDPTYDDFDSVIEGCVLQALVPGWGIPRVQYKAQVTRNEKGEAENLEYEAVCLVLWPWDRFLCGYAKKWADVPWVAFLHHMTKKECEQEFGKEIAAQFDWSKCLAETKAENTGGMVGKLTAEEIESSGLAPVYEIWDKETKKVLYVSELHLDAMLKEENDPYKLSGFFPNPKPLILTRMISDVMPSPLYAYYEKQAAELDHITKRITALIQMLKVRGLYDKFLGMNIGELLKAEDGALLPTENTKAMVDIQSLDKAIWLMPLDKIIVVLQQLYQQRQQVKQVIYETTGISDILRGASVASETATAQQIKNQWGTVRLRRMQKLTAVFARDCLRLLGELAVTTLEPETLKAMTGIALPAEQEKMQAQEVILAAQQAGAEPPPQVMEVLQKPSIEEVVNMLRSDLIRRYRIDIETNSSVDVETTEDKKDIAEFFNAVAQLLNGLMPLVQLGIMPFEGAKAMMLAAVKRYRFGQEVEDYIRQMKQPAQQPGKEGEKGPSQAEQQAKIQEAQINLKVTEQKATLDAQKMEQEAQLASMEFEYKQKEHMMKMQELARKEQLAEAQFSAKVGAIRAQQAADAQRAQESKNAAV